MATLFFTRCLKKLLRKKVNICYVEYVTNQGQYMFSYDKWLQDPIEDQYKRFCEGEDFNPIKDPKEAIYALIEELYEGVQFDSIRASQALQCLVKYHGIKDANDIDYDHPNVVTIQAVDKVRNTEKEHTKDLKKAIKRHVNMLKYELYGDEEIHQNTVNSAIGNLEWLSDEPSSEKKLKIKRG